jgi:hypothetical protein
MALSSAEVAAAQFVGCCCLVGFVAGLTATGLRIAWEAWHGC